MSGPIQSIGSRAEPLFAPGRTAAPDPIDRTAPVDFGAGRDPAIPQRFLWALDALVQLGAFCLAPHLAPLVQRLIVPGGPLHVAWLAQLSLPAENALTGFPRSADLLWVPLVMVPTTLLFMHVLRGYRALHLQSRTRLALTTVVSPLLGLSFTTLVMFTVKTHPSRTFVFSLTLLSIAGLFSYRTAIRYYKKNRLAAGAYARNVLVIGSAEAVAWMSRLFAKSVPRNVMRAVGFLQTANSASGRDAQPSPQQEDVDLPSLGCVDDLERLLINRPVHEVVAVQPATDGVWLRKVIDTCDYFRVTLRIVPETLLSGGLHDLELVYRSGPLHLPEIVLKPPELDSDALFLKRVIDILVSGVLLVLLAPVFLAIAVAIKLTTPHLSVLYPWRVVGYKGKRFTGYKFTTMVADADERKKELMHLNEMTGPVFKLGDDPRVTPLGRFLRKYSLNELPQLWSVFKGDMSLVGPRPAGPHELARYELWHKRKLSVQPGITCLWQVRGRNAISDFDDWVRMDLEYIDKWSLWLDTRILVRTAWAVLAGTGS